MAVRDTARLFFLLTWMCSFLPALRAELCSYLGFDYNNYDMRFEKMVTYKWCQWGCCWKFQDPCCSTPVGLIVGCAFGGLLLVAMVMIAIFCCCRQRRGPSASTGTVIQYHADRGHSFPSNSEDSTLNTSIPPGVYQPPPSYEDVMAGRVNLAFKADGSTQ